MNDVSTIRILELLAPAWERRHLACFFPNCEISTSKSPAKPEIISGMIWLVARARFCGAPWSGARNSTGVLKRALIPATWEYVGLDVAADDNVDVIGDAHALRRSFKKDSFDAVFALAVFEHLIMPWKAVLEINHILRRGGLFLAVTHQTFPLHEEPWDYFRFSAHSWRALFNQHTGFTSSARSKAARLR
jgi:SAM-dependent methyltransferase